MHIAFIKVVHFSEKLHSFTQELTSKKSHLFYYNTAYRVPDKLLMKVFYKFASRHIYEKIGRVRFILYNRKI